MALNGWTNKCPLTINSSLVTADLTNFTVLFNASALPTELLAASGGCNTDGSDIRFATDSAGNTLLDFDLVHIDKTASEIVVYVKTDILSATDTTIYLFWGNSTATAPVTNTWSDFYAAIHMQESPTGDGFKTFKDSAGTYNALSEDGTPVSVSGMIAGHNAVQVTSNNYIVLEEEMNISGDFFFEFWINYNGTAPTAGTQNLFCPVDYFSGVGTTGIGINFGALTVRDVVIGGAQWSDWSVWHHVAFYVSGGTMYYYLDGSLHSSAAFTTSIERLKWLSGEGSGRPIQFSSVGYSIAGIKFTRITTTMDSPNVIQTRWNNFNSLGSFITVGTVETVTIQTTLTLTGLQPSSEVRIYDNSLTELAGVENSTDTFSYSYDYVSDVDAIIVIHSLGYEYIRLPITLTNTSNSIPIQQRVDRNYNNP